MIHFIIGKPGGGKSYRAMEKYLWPELAAGSRVIVTNLALRLDVLNALYAKLPGYETRSHIANRIVQLKDEQIERFYSYYDPCCEPLDVPDRESWYRGQRTDFSKRTVGVLFIIDEIHIAFNSRDWARTGPQVLFYLSQHRKLGDDVICITQDLANVDKQFRSMAQDFKAVKNLAKIKVGLFRLPAKFVERTYLTPPKFGTSCASVEFFQLGPLAEAYDTAGGIGIHGMSGADIGEKAPGFHWAWAVGLALVLAMCGFRYGPSLFVRAVFPSVNKGQPDWSPRAQQSENPPAENEYQRAESGVSSSIRCVGVFISPAGVVALLDNGDVLSRVDGSLSMMQDDQVVDSAGVRYKIAKRPDRWPEISANEAGPSASIEILSETNKGGFERAIARRQNALVFGK